MSLRSKTDPSPHGLTKGKAATINDIARLSGVSKKTVSRIINNSPLVRKDTRDKVEALMREVGYTPDPLARGLAFRRSFLIGMVYDNPTAQYIVDMQYGALDALRVGRGPPRGGDRVDACQLQPEGPDGQPDQEVNHGGAERQILER